jgi:hypothetical protein
VSYTVSRLSNYEGHRRHEAMLEKVATGKLQPGREVARDHLCEVCQCRKRNVRVVPSLVMGRKLAATKMVGRFVIACEDCARNLERAGVPQAAVAQVTRMAALGLVMP